jgi:archaellin
MTESGSFNPKLAIVYILYVAPKATLIISNINPINISFTFLNCNTSFNISFQINITFGWYNISVEMNGIKIHSINSTANKTVTFNVLDNLSLITKNYTVYFNGTCTLNTTKKTIWLNIITQNCISLGNYIVISNIHPYNETIDFYFCNDSFIIQFIINTSNGGWHNISFYMNGTLIYFKNDSGNNTYYFDVLQNKSMYYGNNYSLYYNGTCPGNYTNKSFWINTGNEIFCSALYLDPFLILLTYLFAILYFIMSNKTNQLFIASKAHYIFILCSLVLLLGIEASAFIGYGITDLLQRALILPFILVFIALLWLTRIDAKEK